MVFIAPMVPAWHPVRYGSGPFQALQGPPAQQAPQQGSTTSNAPTTPSLSPSPSLSQLSSVDTTSPAKTPPGVLQHQAYERFRGQQSSRPAEPQPSTSLHQRQSSIPPSRSPQQLFEQHIPSHYQTQQQQQGSFVSMNGMNGANMGGGVPVPTPAGHQAELNYIYGMVEELSRQLADNRRVTEDIVSGLGKVRNKAKTQGLANDDVISSAAEEIHAQDDNLDALVSVLSESLEKAKFSRDANATLLSQYANALGLILRQFHDYKSRHVADVAAWHHSYRGQLDEARRENSRLREQIWEMQTHAGRANESLRVFRKRYTEDESRWDQSARETALRQELRFWKRLAMPELDDDDPYWSADDDIIDPTEKERLRELELRAAHEQLADSQAEDSDGIPQHLPVMSMMGSIAMQREEISPAEPMPPPPLRPLSAASSTGSVGPES